MEKPLISVVVPVYNSAEWLSQCLNSIVNQTFRALEIICVDDGSTDESGAILNVYAALDSRITVITRDSSSGSGALPRNTGMDIACGKYIMFLDSDDYFDLQMLEKLIARAEELNADLVMCDNYELTVAGEISTENTELHYEYIPTPSVFSYLDIPDTIYQISNAAVWHKLILRETLVKHGLRFQEETPILDDIYFVNMLLVLSQKISIIPDRLVYYRRYRTGSQTSNISRYKSSVYYAFNALNKELIARSIYDAVKKSLINWTLATMAWWIETIVDLKVYCEVYDIYRAEYFRKLGIAGANPLEIYDEGLREWYEAITGAAMRPFLHTLLNDILPCGSAIALYGAGVVGRNIFAMIQNHKRHAVTLWCDRNFEKMNNAAIKSPHELSNRELDAVIIGIADKKAALEVSEYLLSLGISSGKIYHPIVF